MKCYLNYSHFCLYYFSGLLFNFLSVSFLPDNRHYQPDFKQPLRGLPNNANFSMKLPPLSRDAIFLTKTGQAS
jgi:hypothetical protein